MLSIRQSSGKSAVTSPRIALAVAGGGPLGGIYELGALRALDDCVDGLRLTDLDAYVGVSSGAFVAAALANGVNPSQMTRIFIDSASNEHPLTPEMFLRPAFGEFLSRVRALPGVCLDSIRTLLAAPLSMPLSDTLSHWMRLIPNGICDSYALENFLADMFARDGRSNDFRDLNNPLYIVAVDLDTGGAVRFGADGYNDVPISRAVVASAALPGLFPPVEIDGNYYVDGALRRTLHASAALEHGCDLLLAINPLVPFDNTAHRRKCKDKGLVDRGLVTVLSQTFRAMIQSRMKVGMQRYEDQYPDTDFLLFEPENDDTEMFYTNVFSYSDRQRLCEHAYQVTRQQLLDSRAQLEPALERFGLGLIDAHLLDPERSYQTGMQGPISSTNPVSGRLANVLGDLEGWIRTQRESQSSS